MVVIVPATWADRDVLYEICLKTAYAGEDATSMFPDCPDALGDRWVGPYLKLPRTVAIAIKDDEGICGYTLAAEDSKEFYKQLAEEWGPAAARNYPERATEGFPLQQQTIDDLRSLKVNCPDSLYERFPAHMHIDILPRAQGKGNGRLLIEALIAELGRRGVKGLHLEMYQSNTKAEGFYSHLGFEVVSKHGHLQNMAIAIPQPTAQ